MELLRDDLQATCTGLPRAAAVTRPSLIIVQSPAASCIGKIIPILSSVTIGRTSEAQIVLDDPALSRRHLEIGLTEDGCTLRDLGSRNGTRVNGEDIVAAMPLRPGDQIEVGSTVLHFVSSMESDLWVRRTLAHSAVALWEYTAGSDELLFSDDIDRALDLPLDTLGNRRVALAHCVHADDRERLTAALHDAYAGAPLELEIRIVPFPTVVRWVILRGQIDHASLRGGRVYVSGTVVDITSVKREAIAVSRAALVFESFLDGVALTDHAGVIVDMNPAMAQLFGVERSTAIGRELFAIVPAGEASKLLADARNAVERADRWTATVRMQRHVFDLLAFPLRTDQGDRAGITWIFRDVSEKHQMQSQIAFLDRLASLGTLSAGLAHEINNPLTFILGNAEFLRDELLAAGNSPHVQALSEIMEGAQRIATIVRDLKAFARAEHETVAQATDVFKAIGMATKLTGSVLRGRCQVIAATDPIAPAMAVESRLVQVLVNILVNAAQSLPSDRVAPGIFVQATNERGGIAIEITDKGSGMSPDVVARAFEPFFTTKPLGGTGLGLSICHGLVTGMGGTIALTSRLGHGTTVTIWLPRAAPAPSAAAPEAPHVAAAERLRVLVIDDEPVVLRTVARLLRDHEIVTADGYASAVEHLVERREHFDVILCDLMMPGGTGMELHDRLLVDRPELVPHLVFVTGGASTERSREFLENTKNRYLLKPIDRHTLRRTVAEAHAHGSA